MDPLWLSAPCLAVRLWLDAQPERAWQLNPAAQQWAGPRGVGAQHWQSLVQQLCSVLDAAKPDAANSPRGCATIGLPPIDLDWVAVPLPDGWLVWLQIIEAAQAYNRRMETVANAASVGIWSFDIETQRVEWNEQMYLIYGLPVGSELPTVRRWLDEMVYPADREIASNHRALSIPPGHVGLQSEFRVVRPDGMQRWVSAWSRRELIGGRETSLGINIDVTELHSAQSELQRMQERARLAAMAAGIGTWERDLRTSKSRWDAQMFRLRGYDPELGYSPEALRELTHHPDDIDQLDRKKVHAMRDRQIFEHEYRVIWPDGSVHWLASRGVVQPGDRLLGVNWDITERKRAEQALRDKAAAEQASQAKSAFLARMSHELRTPLNAVLGFADVLVHSATSVLTVPQRGHVERIHSAGLHLLALIDDVLDLASIESNKLPLSSESVSLQTLFDGVQQWVQLQADKAGVTLQAEPLQGHVRGDPRRLRQVLANLLSNAIKYNQPNGAVWVRSQSCQHEGQAAWEIHVRDSGRGLSFHQRQHLFEPFNRLGAERDGIEGTGIGLAIVRHLVKLMGGEISVHSEEGKGSDFRVVLPAAEPAGDAIDGADARASAPSRTVHPKLSVLYIEDNPVNVLLVQELLAMMENVALDIAEDGLSGVAQAQALQPDVVLIDMQLPDIDGFEVLKRLRADPATARGTMVALSANAMPEDVARARRAGFDDYWTKPIDFKTFVRALGALADARSP